MPLPYRRVLARTPYTDFFLPSGFYRSLSSSNSLLHPLLLTSSPSPRPSLLFPFPSPALSYSSPFVFPSAFFSIPFSPFLWVAWGDGSRSDPFLSQPRVVDSLLLAPHHHRSRPQFLCHETDAPLFPSDASKGRLVMRGFRFSQSMFITLPARSLVPPPARLGSSFRT